MDFSESAAVSKRLAEPAGYIDSKIAIDFDNATIRQEAEARINARQFAREAGYEIILIADRGRHLVFHRLAR